MARRKVAPSRKRRTRGHVLADLSANFVERHVLLCGHTVERVIHDYGVDLVMHTFRKNGEIENGEIAIQLKATRKPKLVGNGSAVAIRIETADLHYWKDEIMPVVLILYDSVADEAFWLYIQRHVQADTKPSIDFSKKWATIHIPVSNKMDIGAVKQFAKFKRRILDQRKGIKHHE